MEGKMVNKTKIILIILILVTATNLTSHAQTIGEAIVTYSLQSGNNKSRGLAYCTHWAMPGLYVADYDDNILYAYSLKVGLIAMPLENIDTLSLDPDFEHPRGLAYGEYNGIPYLYALTSNDFDGDGVYDSRLWRIELSSMDTDWIDLNASEFGLDGKVVFGLTYNGGRVYISYDTSHHLSDLWQVRHGIMKLKVYEAEKPNNWWVKAGSGDADAVEQHMPNSGRWTDQDSTYSRAPAFGLAYMDLDSNQYLWGTSYAKYIYLADGLTGRGIFYFDSPGGGNIQGLAYGGGYLWAVDDIDGTDQLHKIKVKGDYDVPVQGSRNVRHLSVKLKSTTVTPVICHLKHNFAAVHTNSYRPSQNHDNDSPDIDHNGEASWVSMSYTPAGDTSARQYYYQVEFSGNLSSDTSRWSRYETDFWNSDYQHFVYPHLCDSSGASKYEGYIECSGDDDKVYGLSDTTAYSNFWNQLKSDIEDEYGSDAQFGNTYWLIRNMHEFIKENYQYGNTSDTLKGHHSYNPSNFKLELIFDGDPGNDLMSCSTSAFALAGLCKYKNIPARWIGTTKWRGDWDDNEDGIWDDGEKAVDETFHRWIEAWLGETYGWQRFDPTPGGTGPNFMKLSEVAFADFNGDGRTDVFYSGDISSKSNKDSICDAEEDSEEENKWCASYDGTSGWIELNNSSIKVADLAFGDFNGDGKADVFRADGSKWQVSYGGTEKWEELTNSSLGIDDIAFGDFNGDGVTDVFRATGSVWKYCSGGNGKWVRLNTSNITLPNFAFGDFDGDGVTDVFRADGNNWHISYGGREDWDTLSGSSSLLVSDLAFADFDGDGDTDIFNATGSNWRVSDKFPGKWRKLISSTYTLDDLGFGDFNGDGKTDVFRANGTEWYVSYSGNSKWSELNTGEYDQFRLMGGSACGVSTGDLVLTIGSGYHEPFYRQKDFCQRYNSVPRYESSLLWEDDIYIESTWSNACFIKIDSPKKTLYTKTPEIKWSCTGRWDMDPSATVSIYLQRMESDGVTEDGGPEVLESGLPYDTGSVTVDLSNCDAGYYRFDVIKDGDSRTGAKGNVLGILPDLETTITSIDTKDYGTSGDKYVITMSVRIENVGTKPCDDFEVKWSGSPVIEAETSSDGPTQPLDQYPATKTITVGGMSEGDSVEMSNSWLVDKSLYDGLTNGTRKGFFSISCEADEPDVIEELRESNNKASYTLTSLDEGFFKNPEAELDKIIDQNPEVDRGIIEAVSQDILQELLNSPDGVDPGPWITHQAGITTVWQTAPDLLTGEQVRAEQPRQ